MNNKNKIISLSLLSSSGSVSAGLDIGFGQLWKEITERNEIVLLSLNNAVYGNDEISFGNTYRYPVYYSDRGEEYINFVWDDVLDIFVYDSAFGRAQVKQLVHSPETDEYYLICVNGHIIR